MRVECSRCRQLVEVAGLSPVEGGLGFSCSSCGGVSVLAPVVPAAPVPTVSAPSVPSGPAALSLSKHPIEAPKASTPSEPVGILATAPALPPGFSPCPKCSAPYASDVKACARCGLVFAKVASGRAKLPPPLVVAPALRERWAQLAVRLDDTEAHFAFIEACGAQNALEFAGQCYRALTVPGQLEDDRVAVFRDRVLRHATVRVQLVANPRAAEAVAERQRAQRLTGALVVAFFVGLLAVGYWYSTRLTNAMQLAP